MNSLGSLFEVCQQLPDKKNSIAAYEAERFKIQTPNGKLIADVGCKPILHMRQFQVFVFLVDSNLKCPFLQQKLTDFSGLFSSLMCRPRKNCLRSWLITSSIRRAIEDNYFSDTLRLHGDLSVSFFFPLLNKLFSLNFYRFLIANYILRLVELDFSSTYISFSCCIDIKKIIKSPNKQWPIVPHLIL